MAKLMFPAICGRITESMFSIQLEVFVICQLDSMVYAGMMVENTGNIMAAMTRVWHSFFALKSKRTSAKDARPARIITPRVTQPDMKILFMYA